MNIAVGVKGRRIIRDHDARLQPEDGVGTVDGKGSRTVESIHKVLKVIRVVGLEELLHSFGESHPGYAFDAFWMEVDRQIDVCNGVGFENGAPTRLPE